MANTKPDASQITWLRDLVGAIKTTLSKWLGWQDACIFEFLTDAQIAKIRAYSFDEDMTAVINAALAVIRADKRNAYFPAGGYYGNFIIPGTVDGVGIDDRNTGFRIFGQGFGEPFVTSNNGGTVFKGVTAVEQPVLTDILGTASSSNGTIEVDRIRFDGNTATVPVVKLQSFYGQSSFHHNCIHQRGIGDGFVAGWGATVEVHNNYCMNKDFVTFGLGAARTGTGFSYIPTADNGLVTFRKNTSRGWLTAYQLAGGAGAAYSASIRECEGSVIYNGVILQSNADKCNVSNCYFEGGDGGVGVNNLGDYNTIRGNLFFAGFATAIQDTSTSNKGSLIDSNLIALGATVNGIGIDVTSSASFGGFNKNVTNNSIAYTLGTNGVNGIKLSGATPRVNITGNSFDTRGNWTGTSTLKINDTSTGGVFGVLTKQSTDWEFPYLSGGAISLFRGWAALTESAVVANNMTIPEGSYFTVTATVATTVQRFTAGETAGRFVIIRTTNANTSFTDTAYAQLAGGVTFTGPGMITLFIDKVGADSYAYEISRTVF